MDSEFPLLEEQATQAVPGEVVEVVEQLLVAAVDFEVATAKGKEEEEGKL
jgi:hypothetical protein